MSWRECFMISLSPLVTPFATSRATIHRATSGHTGRRGFQQPSGLPGYTKIHTAEDVRDFGGLIGVAADAQIHSPRDNVLNVNVVSETKMTRVYAGVLQHLAQDSNIRTTLYVTHGEREVMPAPLVEEQWDAIVEEKRTMGRSGPEDDFHSWFPLAREWVRIEA